MTTKPLEAMNPLERMKQAGAMLANCAFNLAQCDRLNERERRSLAESRIAWDEAMSALNASDGWVCVPVEPADGAIDSAVAFALNVSISSEYNWSAYMRDLWLKMIHASQQKDNANEQ